MLGSQHAVLPATNRLLRSLAEAAAQLVPRRPPTCTIVPACGSRHSGRSLRQPLQKPHLVRLLVCKAHDLVFNGGAVAGPLGVHPPVLNQWGRASEGVIETSRRSAAVLAQQICAGSPRAAPIPTQCQAQPRWQPRAGAFEQRGSCEQTSRHPPAIHGRLMQVLLQTPRGQGSRAAGGR